MKIIRYDYVIKVAETRSISKAAQDLYMSQPALTKAINNIEEELGVQLFNRKIKPLSLTYAGEVFVDRARKILRLQDDMQNAMETISDIKKTRLAIGISASRAEDYMPAVLPIYKKIYPGVEIKLVECPQETLEEQVEKESIDIAILSTPTDNSSFVSEILDTEQIVIVMSKDNPILEGKDLSKTSLDNPLLLKPEDLKGADMISLSPGMNMFKFQKYLIEKYDIQPNIVLQTVSLETAFYMACVNYGFAIVPEVSVISEFPRWLPAICTLETPSLSRNTSIMYKKGRQLSLAAEKFIETTKKVTNSKCPFFARPSQKAFEDARKGVISNSDVELIMKWQEDFLSS